MSMKAAKGAVGSKDNDLSEFITRLKEANDNPTVKAYLEREKGTAATIAVPVGPTICLSQATEGLTTMLDKTLALAIRDVFAAGAEQSHSLGEEVKVVLCKKTEGEDETIEGDADWGEAFKNYAKMSDENKTTLLQAFCELHEASLAAELSHKNVRSWVKSHRLAPWLAAWAHRNMASVAAAPFPAPTQMTKWNEYRVSKQATSSLCKAALSIMGDLAKYVFSKDEVDLINLTNAYLTDTTIPQYTIGKCAVILQSNKYDFGDWYQGTHALQVMSYGTKVSLQTAMRKVAELSAEGRMIDASRTPAQALASAIDMSETEAVRDEVKAAIKTAQVQQAAVAAARAHNKTIITMPEGVTVSEVNDVIATNVEIKKSLEGL